MVASADGCVAKGGARLPGQKGPGPSHPALPPFMYRLVPKGGGVECTLGVPDSGEPTPHLLIFPSQPVQTKALGKSALLTCRADVENIELIQDLKWIDPNGRTVEHDSEGQDSSELKRRMYTEIMPGGDLALFIKSLTETEAGNYTCEAIYANTDTLRKIVRIETIEAITFVDAPEEQYPILGAPFKVKCLVKANPAPIVDWYKNSEMIQTDHHYVVETDGLLIKNVTEMDDGVYNCRAIVIKSGELNDRSIRVEVHVPPRFQEPLQTLEAVEGKATSMTCLAVGKPPPIYSWIKSSTKEDLSNPTNPSTAGRFSVDKNTGVLNILSVHREDEGELKCVAENAAGKIEQSAQLSVIVPPRVLSLANASMATGKSGMLTCRASGMPPPVIHFKRYGSQTRFVAGGQPDDDHVYVEPVAITDADKFIEGEEVTAGANFVVQNAIRSDDGLYWCVAQNKGGEDQRIGHVTVEFSPSFASSPMKQVWSWHNNPVNLTCLAESIPNATITWWLNGRNVENDQNMLKIGNGPESTLTVTPYDQRYYGIYVCRATNVHGDAEHEIQLREAHRPSEVLQAKLEVITATTITFSFIGPRENGGLPVRAYAVQYKEERKTWNEARNKTWFIDSPYILEGLEPQTSYNFRFAAKNDVGLGEWSADEHHTMPKRSNPEEPKILSSGILGSHPGPESEVVMSPYVNRFELRWKIPADNGEPIDKYDIKFCPAKKTSEGWKESDKCDTIELKSHDHTAHELRNLQANTHYKIELRAHNGIGYSTPGQIIVKTARDPTSNTASDPYMKEESTALSSGIIIGIVVAALVIVLIIIDMSCCVVNRAGLLAMICLKNKKEPKEQDIKNECSREQEPLKTINSNKYSVHDEEMQRTEAPLIPTENVKRDTAVDFDFKNATSRTTFVKNSAV
ncbi:fasciclin-2 [Ischnura elegans]|uniref:fasciclin-2 n=1 Tax=Ischnura elegans TaxID=197161 RepID=UPI001ED8A1E7|nr:fasciclin-2 [Ischnura elegans]